MLKLSGSVPQYPTQSLLLGHFGDFWDTEGEKSPDCWIGKQVTPLPSCLVMVFEGERSFNCLEHVSDEQNYDHNHIFFHFNLIANFSKCVPIILSEVTNYLWSRRIMTIHIWQGREHRSELPRIIQLPTEPGRRDFFWLSSSALPLYFLILDGTWILPLGKCRSPIYASKVRMKIHPRQQSYLKAIALGR